MTTREDSIALIKSFESLRLTAYPDSKGVWTLGYGRTEGVRQGMTCTKEQAEGWVRLKVTAVEAALSNAITVPLTHDQYVALTSLTYNIGIHAFETSALLHMLNLCDFSGAAEEFVKWDHCNHVEVPGLKNRRMKERELFLKA